MNATALEPTDTVGQRLDRIRQALVLIQTSIVALAASKAIQNEIMDVLGAPLEALIATDVLKMMGAAAVEAQDELSRVTEGAPNALTMPALLT